MKPKLRFPEFNAEWSNVILGDILDFKNGYNADKEDYGSGTPFINVSDILNNESIMSSNLNQSVQISEHALKGFNVKKGDLLFQRSSETREEVGTVNVYIDNKIVTFGGFVIRGRLKSLVSTPYVLKLALSTATARKRITSKSGGSTRYNIGQDSLAEVAICVPTTQESERIESIFYLLSEKINLLNKKKQALEAYKKGLMQKIFSQELRFKREDGTDYPQWYTNKLGEISSIIKGQQLNRDSMLEHGTIPVLNGGISWSGYTSTPNTPSDSITISEGGNSCGYVSFVQQPFWSGGHNYSLRLNPEHHVRYLYHYLKYSEPSIMKLRVGSGLPNIQKKDISKFNCLIPYLEEQKHIANLLNVVDGQISIHKELVLRTQELKKGLLQQMFV